MNFNNTIQFSIMKSFYFIVILVITTPIFAQTNGFLGRKNIIEFGVIGQNPLVYNISGFGETFNSAYINKNGVLENRAKQLSYGFRLSLGRMILRNLGLHLESGLNYFSVVPKLDPDSYDSKYNLLEAQMVDIKGYSIMPKIEFASDDALLPIGISNQIGLGFNSYKTISKDYIGTVEFEDENYSYNTMAINRENYYNYGSSAIKGYTLLYKLNLRIPISERLLFNFGFRYTFNFVSGNTLYSVTSDQILTQSDMWRMIKTKENRNLFNLETGISFSF